eukprot:m.71268 g.71268  ORF g.71268 m.71268 type:complete len:274 (+) comp16081_c0_seq12:155-976(+)
MALQYTIRRVGVHYIKNISPSVRVEARCGLAANVSRSAMAHSFLLPAPTKRSAQGAAAAASTGNNNVIFLSASYNTPGLTEFHAVRKVPYVPAIMRVTSQTAFNMRGMSTSNSGHDQDRDRPTNKGSENTKQTMRARMGQRGKDAAQQVRQRVGEKGKEVGQQVGAGFKDLYNKYGRAAIVTYFSLDAVTFTSCYLAVRNGVDIVGVIQAMGLPVSVDMLGFAPTAGTFVIALAVNKLTLPFRLAATAAIVPRSSKYLRERFPAVFDVPAIKK